VIPPPPAELISGYLEYEAEMVIDHDPKRRRNLVKWAGYGHENNTWEGGAGEVIQEYWQGVDTRDQRKADIESVESSKIVKCAAELKINLLPLGNCRSQEMCSKDFGTESKHSMKCFGFDQGGLEAKV